MKRPVWRFEVGPGFRGLRAAALIFSFFLAKGRRTGILDISSMQNDFHLLEIVRYCPFGEDISPGAVLLQPQHSRNAGWCFERLQTKPSK
jgi:hypothetical protein